MLSTHPLKPVIQETAIRIYEAVMEEIAILAKGEGFQDISGDEIVDLLESLSLPLTNEEMAEMNMRTYKEAQNDDDERVTSEENTLTMLSRGLSENFRKINGAVDYFGTMIPSMIILPRLNVNRKMWCHAIKKF
jgi:hypothetical protein